VSMFMFCPCSVHAVSMFMLCPLNMDTAWTEHGHNINMDTTWTWTQHKHGHSMDTFIFVIVWCLFEWKRIYVGLYCIVLFINVFLRDILLSRGEGKGGRWDPIYLHGL
jgi:hypothetical protein